MRIYLASSWRNPEQPELVAFLRELGHEVYDFRNPPGGAGFDWRDLVETGRDWTPAAFVEALAHPDALAGFDADFAGLRWAEACVLALPCGRSAHLELGWMIGAGKPSIIYAPELPGPELMYRLAGDRPLALSRDELAAWTARRPARAADDHAGLAIDSAGRILHSIERETEDLVLRGAPSAELGALLHLVLITWIDRLVDAHLADPEAPAIDDLTEAIATISGRAIATRQGSLGIMVGRQARAVLAHAVEYVLRRRQTDPDFGYYLSPGTEAFDRLVRALAAHTGDSVGDVGERYRHDAQPEHRRRDPDVVVLKRRVERLEREIVRLGGDPEACLVPEVP